MLRIRVLLVLVLAVSGGRIAAAQNADPPKVVIYSFSGGDAVPAGMGAQIADTLTVDARVGGGVTVVRGSPALTPSQYRADARAQDADYYLIGSVAAVGTRYSVLEQLVRVRTGLLLWSVSYQIADATDLVGQGATVRAIVLEQERRSEIRPPSTPPPKS